MTMSSASSTSLLRKSFGKFGGVFNHSFTADIPTSGSILSCSKNFISDKALIHPRYPISIANPILKDGVEQANISELSLPYLCGAVSV
jgi:hypothetical protein